MKRLLIVLLSLIMVLVMFGCKGNPKGEEGGEAENAISIYDALKIPDTTKTVTVYGYCTYWTDTEMIVVLEPKASSDPSYKAGDPYVVAAPAEPTDLGLLSEAESKAEREIGPGKYLLLVTLAGDLKPLNERSIDFLNGVVVLDNAKILSIKQVVR